jgi:hypothetical protein
MTSGFFSAPTFENKFTYDGDTGAQFSWSNWCTGSGDAGCAAIDEAIVKFDLYGNSGPGQELTNYCQASTTIGGTYPQGGGGGHCSSSSDLNMASAGISLQSTHVFSVTLTYDGSNLTESITDTSTSANYTHTYTGISLPTIIGANTAFVGFGDGTGAALMNVNIHSWTYKATSSGGSMGAQSKVGTELKGPGQLQ